jgi:predicted Zn-dependent peptidase
MFVDAGLFAAYAGTTPARAKEVLAILREQLQDVADGGLTEEEFERAKGHTKGSLVLSLDDPSGRMSRLGKSEISHGEILTLNDTLKRIDAVSYEGARAVAKRVLSQPTSLAVIGPFSRAALR